MDDAAFEAWARARRLPPGLRLGAGGSLSAYLRRRFWRPVRNPMFQTAMWCIGRHAAGLAEARAVRLVSREVAVPGLAPQLDGFRILHLSDLHLGVLPGLEDYIAAALAGVEAELCVVTGDYAPFYTADPARVVGTLRPLLRQVQSRHGILLTLGNYDSPRLAAALRAEDDWRLLVNANHWIEHDGARLAVTGLDDPYEQPHALLLQALAEPADGFRIVLAHAPEPVSYTHLTLPTIYSV